MSASLQKPMTKQEFLAWEEGQEFKWEFDGFGPVAMTGVSIGACPESGVRGWFQELSSTRR